MAKQVPKETKGLFLDREGKYIIDTPLRIKSCTKCWRPLYFKNNRLYCPNCKKFRNVKTSQWIDHNSNIQFVTKAQIGLW